MDELLFISMARLGADKLRTEWEKPLTGSLPGHAMPRHSTRTQDRRTWDARRIGSATLGYGALALAIVLLAILVVAVLASWHGPSADVIPRGEVHVTQLGQAASVQGAPGDTGVTAARRLSRYRA